MQMLMFEPSGKGESSTKAVAPAAMAGRVKKDAPIHPPARSASMEIDRPQRPHGVEEEADRWDGLY